MTNIVRIQDKKVVLRVNSKNSYIDTKWKSIGTIEDGTFQIRRINNIVFSRIIASTEKFSINSLVSDEKLNFTIPEGFRPDNTHDLFILDGFGAFTAKLTIKQGDIYLSTYQVSNDLSWNAMWVTDDEL